MKKEISWNPNFNTLVYNPRQGVIGAIDCTDRLDTHSIMSVLFCFTKLVSIECRYSEQLKTQDAFQRALKNIERKIKNTELDKSFWVMSLEKSNTLSKKLESLTLLKSDYTIDYYIDKNEEEGRKLYSNLGNTTSGRTVQKLCEKIEKNNNALRDLTLNSSEIQFSGDLCGISLKDQGIYPTKNILTTADRVIARDLLAKHISRCNREIEEKNITISDCKDMIEYSKLVVDRKLIKLEK